MNDQQLLEIDILRDPVQIQQALSKKIANLDFEIDIERILTYIEAAQRLNKQLEAGIQEKEMLLNDSDTEQSVAFNEACTTPEKLIACFVDLYDNSKTRYNTKLWASYIDYVKENDPDNLAHYCKTIADFLIKKPYLKSETLRLLANGFPFGDFFPDPKEEKNKPFWESYGFIYNILRKGNFELDIIIAAIDLGAFTADQIDDLYNRLFYSARFYREGNYVQAYNLLSEGIPKEVKPLLVWQRELTILYKAGIVDKAENVATLFEQILNLALSYFPEDEHLLYLRAKFIFHTAETVVAQKAIIEVLKSIPGNEKCLILLSKCNVLLGRTRAALHIVEHLSKRNPLNLQYVTATAVARRRYIDFCLKEYDPNDNSKQYYIKNIQMLINYEMFDEAVTLAMQGPEEDADIKALLLYAKDVKRHSLSGKKNFNELKEAVSLTANKEIQYNIQTYYLNNIQSWAEITDQKEFILEFHTANPTDAMSNYHRGLSFYAVNDFEQAYEYFLKAKDLDPTIYGNYYNLARATTECGLYSEAIEYIAVYLQYNKYHLTSNALHCEWLFKIKKFKEAHSAAKWILSICRANEYDTKYFFYFSVSLGYYLDTIPKENHNAAYIDHMVTLFESYPKPTSFWEEGNGIKSIYGMAKLCHDSGNFENCVTYIKQLLEYTTNHTDPTVRICLFEFLPQSLNALGRYEELIERVGEPALNFINDQSNKNTYQGANPAYYISIAFNKLEQYIEQMDWAERAVQCYLQSDKPPIDWIENYLMDKLNICLVHAMHSNLISLGNIFLNEIQATTMNHIWVAHQVANAYQAYDEPKEALMFHRICVSYGSEFPSQYEDEIKASQQYINTITASQSAN